MSSEVVALVCLGWFVFIALVCAIGYIQLFLHYLQPPRRAVVLSRPDSAAPHVTAIRPCKGHEPYLYECLAATFNQDYPKKRLTVHLCVASRHDAAYSTLQKVVRDHPDHDVRVYIEDEDPRLQEDAQRLGPNPKIRNMSRAYREARGDIIWIIDCNVWINPGACGRMVDKLVGNAHDAGPQRPYKLVHHLPVAVEVHATLPISLQRRTSMSHDSITGTAKSARLPPFISSLANTAFGGMLEELFLASSHAKMYVAINTVAVAPCIVGKSTMFRRSQLDVLTGSKSRHNGTLGATGIDFFSNNICEDHLIGDLLWKSNMAPDEHGLSFHNHGLVMGDLAIQPVAGMSIANYVARRVRWLRVRKYTVPTATAVEPGTESFLCSFMGAWGATTSVRTRHLFGETWSDLLLWFVVSIVLWGLVDRTVHLLLHSGLTIEKMDEQTPDFAKPRSNTWRARRSFWTWAKAWVCREALALPIWLWAIWGGATVTWREKKFWVGMDMKVHEFDEQPTAKIATLANGSVASDMNGHAGIAGAGRGKQRKE